MVNLASPKTFEIIEYILENAQFTQYRASKDLKNISFGLINRVSNWLLGRRLIARRESKYLLSDPAGRHFIDERAADAADSEKRCFLPGFRAQPVEQLL